jgi:nicotinate-nucleotide adenylyltransferase
MQIGLYFGSFNPIHQGHLIIASYAVEHTPIEEVWLVVSPQNPFKPAGSLLNEYQRLHLARVATEGDARLKASDVEFNLPKPSYTINTLTYLREQFPQHHFSIVLGADSYENIDRWKQGALLLEQLVFYVYPRPGFDTNLAKAKQAHLLKAPLLNISATYIRQQIQAGKSIQYLVPPAVSKEIEAGNYYR